jgi:hypothetical protein
MGDIDTLRRRGVPYWALVNGQGVAINGTATLAVLWRRSMEAVCQVDASGAAADASTLKQLQARGIQNFCEVNETGTDPVSGATLVQLMARGIIPKCPVDVNGVAQTGTATIEALRRRGIGYFCPLDENGTATTVSDPLAPGAPGALTNQSANTVLSPVIRVTLNAGAGVLANIATDVVTLYANGVSVGTATLIAGDITAGYVDITSSARPGTPDTFTARSAHGGNVTRRRLSFVRALRLHLQPDRLAHGDRGGRIPDGYFR